MGQLSMEIRTLPGSVLSGNQHPGLLLVALGIFAGALLFPGSFEVGGVGFDIHTFIVTSFLLIVGTQAVSFAVLSRRFATAHQMMSPSKFSSLLEAFTLERLLLVASFLFVGGFLGLIACTIQWAAAGFGPLDYSSMLRLLLLSMTAMAMGGQLALTAFLSSIVEIPTR